jgi:hypothetical protein
MPPRTELVGKFKDRTVPRLTGSDSTRTAVAGGTPDESPPVACVNNQQNKHLHRF